MADQVKAKFKMPSLSKFDRNNLSHKRMQQDLIRLGNKLMLSSLDENTVAYEVQKGWELFNCFKGKSEDISQTVTECMEKFGSDNQHKILWNDIKLMLGSQISVEEKEAEENILDFIDRKLEAVKDNIVLREIERVVPEEMRESALAFVRTNIELRRSKEYKEFVAKMEQIKSRDRVKEAKETMVLPGALFAKAKELDNMLTLCDNLATKVRATFDQEYLKHMRDLSVYEEEYVFEGQAKQILSEEFGFLHGIFNVMNSMNVKIYLVL
jgi:hypothetical protein